LVGTFLKDPIVGGGAGFGFVLGPTLVIAALGVIGNKHFNRHPTWFVVAAALNTAGLFIILYRSAFRSSFWMVVWLSLVCLFTTVVAFMLRQPVELRKTEWEKILFVIVPGVFGLYATKVYPNVLHQYGGGAPVPIVPYAGIAVSSCGCRILCAPCKGCAA
jgi:Ca2+/Na+ antiporter